ncbi:glucose-6-phosphate isomerase [Candidatus Saccharibacteria bacterium]|nr:glucose-6-phosphate isomerase [Candidatus Saccharibacteria bacterium]
MVKLKTSESVELDFRPIEPILEQIKADDFGGWVTAGVDKEELKQIKAAAAKIQKESDYLVCIGIGGSYLGHRAVIEALECQTSDAGVEVLYSGNSLSEFELNRILDIIDGHDFSVNVISKSGTTTEPAVAFRIFKQKLIEKYGEEEAKNRIYATTDQAKGALHDEAVQKGYTTFVVPDNVGGRYSVLTAVGLLPIAAAGVDVDALLEGARDEARLAGLLPTIDELGEERYETDRAKTDAYKYAILRSSLMNRGFNTEVLASFEPRLAMLHEWWKQLFGESEGKNEQGIFPASVVYTTDLHSMGQFMQQGRRDLFETVMHFASDGVDDEITVPEEDGALDGLTYLEGCPLSGINEKALEATITAHRAGNIPVFELEVKKIDAENLGRLIYFFELACAVSGMLQGVNPFDQPGVEQYKREMFHLLGKPGF